MDHLAVKGSIQTEIQPCSGNNFRDDRLGESYWSKVDIQFSSVF